ncbi:hypothetical protein HK102_001220 [Quaeritorhiza haematococci]|nr:hypothetical protein HK102_001220 [Quaeritorhiza haematococci]
MLCRRLGLLLLMLSVTFRPDGTLSGGLLIHGFNASGHEIFAVEKDQPPMHLDVDVFAGISYLTVGNGPKTVEIWMSNLLYERMSYDPYPFIIACALHDITGKVTITGLDFNALPQAPLYNVSGTDNGTLPCPDAIILGTKQISGRYYKDELESLELFCENGQGDGEECDDFVGLLLLADVRALFYNKTLFKELKLKEPPPAESWGEYLKSHPV